MQVEVIFQKMEFVEMKNLLKILTTILLHLFAPLSSQGRVTDSFYIKLGEAHTKRVDLLIQIQPPHTFQSDQFFDELSKTLIHDLTVSSMFNIFFANHIRPPELILSVTYLKKNDRAIINVKAIKNNGSFVFYSEQLKASDTQVRRFAHTIANNFLKNLTGTSGPFLTKFIAATDRAGSPAKEIFYFDWDGANPVKVSNHRSIARSPTWSSDGLKIAYTAYVNLNRKSFPTPQIILYDLILSQAKVLTSRPGNNSGASFTPDGRSVYFTSSADGNNDIYMLSMEAEYPLRKLTKGPNGAMNIETSVSPNGRTVAFSSDRSGNTAIYTMNSDGTDVKRLTHFKEFANSPSWSPDGKRITFAGQDTENFDIFVMDADGGNLKRITQGAKKPNGKPANNEYPSFSSDGRFIMYTSDRTGKNQIYISNEHGTMEFRITNDDFNYYSPKWGWTNN